MKTGIVCGFWYPSTREGRRLISQNQRQAVAFYDTERVEQIDTEEETE